jgi:hypothetical protein
VTARNRPGPSWTRNCSTSHTHLRSVHFATGLPLPLVTMYTKRKRRQNQQYEGLNAGERLKRHKLTSSLAGEWDSPWGWVGTSVTNASDITEEHLLATCGFSRRSHHLFCANKYQKRPAKTIDPSEAVVPSEEPIKDVVIISDDETPTCSKKLCSRNPNCLNYLAQDRWEDAGWPFSFYHWAPYVNGSQMPH